MGNAAAMPPIAISRKCFAYTSYKILVFVYTSYKICFLYGVKWEFVQYLLRTSICTRICRVSRSHLRLYKRSCPHVP